MNEAVFISDLHLDPMAPDITERFDRFIEWALQNTQAVYILGDLFHVWPGDDALDSWSQAQAFKLARLAEGGIKVYFLAGNRDFLLGDRFARLASFTRLKEPTVITLGEKRILLVHGDRYCTLDKGHQWLRRLTRNALFPKLFLKLPYAIRLKIVKEARKRSKGSKKLALPFMDVVPRDLLWHMVKCDVTLLVHGHTHLPGLTEHPFQGTCYQQYVLSDWDDNPLLMCYDQPSGFYFTRLSENYHAS
ncbi:MAG: UDP-2,3-diacylglucosamine diphosphatase [Legionellales bacterium]|nr:UDP-2,3-diacylglucosamine diphosphatase [Legionellales bacterium]